MKLTLSHWWGTPREGDVGGQKTLRSYWRNYFEKTDALVWVVDSSDRMRMADCQAELAGLLLEEVWFHCGYATLSSFVLFLVGCH